MCKPNELLCDFNDALSTYAVLYQSTPGRDEEKLKTLLSQSAEIDSTANPSLGDMFLQLGKDAEALNKELQENQKTIKHFIQSVSDLKNAFTDTAKVLALIDTALALAAGIASKC